MGTLRSGTDHTGMRVGKTTLGQPAQDADADGSPVGEFRWDDALLPNGVIESDGTITLDDPER